MNAKIGLTEAREYIFQLVEQAGEILRKYFTYESFTSRQKEGVDFTTQADEDVDRFLRESIVKRYPQSQFLTEETAPDDYSSLKDVNNLWVIDPLDGTINFSRGNPHFAISIALVDKGISKLGVVYVPMTKSLYHAQENEGGTILNEKQILVSKTSELRETVVGCDWGWNLEKRKNVVEWLDKVYIHVRQIKSMGSAAADLASLAQGKIDVYIHSGLKPWDMAAASLLIQKAGGTITNPDGSVWDVFSQDILATNKVLHKRIIKLLKT